MAAEIVAAIPEYGHLLEGPNARVIKIGIEQSIATFLDRVAAPTATTSLRDRPLPPVRPLRGVRGPQRLDNLQAAYRIGCQVALRRVRRSSRAAKATACPRLLHADLRRRPVRLYR